MRIGDDRDAVAPSAAGLRFVRELGRGGLGSVWLAVQETEEFHRQVAVKLVRRGMDTEDILARFALERQLLAGLEHPNIVRLYGAGSVDDGRPYFVMEYVEGLPIDRFCDERRLSIEARLKLFVQVCKAVHHAHSRLVVHRDLKPSNIIVTSDGTVKLLDFGIAKLVDASLAPVVVDPTAPELRVLTPEYASPEQIRGQMIGTPSDVYSLGVILYELLTGQRPYRIRTRIMRELERIVCEEEPLQPSTVVSRPSEALHVETGADGTTRLVQREVKPETVSKARGVPVDRLSRRLRGDLDVIVLHALEKNPTARYGSAEAMAADVERHLRSEPIEARKTGALGRASRFVRRNRVPVAIASLAVMGAFGGVSGLYFAERARAASDREAAALKLQDAERQLAEMRLGQVRELSDTMLTSFYEKLRPMQGGAELRGLLADAVSRQIESLEKQDSIAGERVADANFDRLLALGYRGLGRVRGDARGEGAGDYASARASYEKSGAILRRLKASAADADQAGLNLELARTLLFWSDTARVAGDLPAAREKLGEAETLLAARGLGASKDERLLHAVVLGELGEIAEKQGDRSGSIEMQGRAIAIRRSLLALEPDDLDLARLLAKGLQVEQSRAEQSGDAERSLALAEEVLAIRSKLAAARPDDARMAREAMLAELARGRALVRAGRAADAVAGLQAACTTATERVERAPDSHEALSDRALGYESLAQTLEEIGRAPEALERTQLARADLARAAQLAPENELYPRRGAYLASREAKTLVGLGRIAEAAATSAAAAEVFEGILAKGSPAADVLQQAAVLFAITSGTSMKAGDAASAERWAVRARAVLAAMPEARRKNIEQFVTGEIGK